MSLEASDETTVGQSTTSLRSGHDQERSQEDSRGKQGIVLCVRRQAIARCLEAWRSKREYKGEVKSDVASASGIYDEVWCVTGRVV